MPKTHLIKAVEPSTIAAECGICAGDTLLSINGKIIEDVFDYRMLLATDSLEVLVRKKEGTKWLLEIEKDEDEDLGLIFSDDLMDEYRNCENKCIFCFIDQMPQCDSLATSLRKTLYFKDDDPRLSFLHGNYTTLTNLTDTDIDRIIDYRFQPINISIHTTDPNKRSLVMGNENAGHTLSFMQKLLAAQIIVNGQIVLCKGINDGIHLDNTLTDLAQFFPTLASVCVVPAGLTRYRDGLFSLSAFEKEDARDVLSIIEKHRATLYKKYGKNLVHAADEWYLLAKRDFPKAAAYDDYPQLENGVGMMRLFIDEFEEAYSELKNQDILSSSYFSAGKKEISIATGSLAYISLQSMSARLCQKLPGLTLHVYEVKNHFFGEGITVSGLITGQDLVEQLSEKTLGSHLLLPANMFAHDSETLLDDMTVKELEKTLQVRIDIVKSSGYDFVKTISGFGDGKAKS